MRKIILFVSLLIFSFLPVKSAVKISLLLSDNFNKAGYETIKQLNNSVEGFREHNQVKLFPYDRFADCDLSFLEQSDLIFVYVHQDEVLSQARAYLETALKKGAKVYALGHTPAEDSYKQMGILFDRQTQSYYDEGGTENLKNMILSRLEKDFSQTLSYSPLIRYPDAGMYLLEKDSIVANIADFEKGYANYKKGNPWVGIYMFRYELLNQQHKHIDALVQAFERAGFNVLPFFGYPITRSVQEFCRDKQGKPLINFLITTAFIQGGAPEANRKAFSELGVPVINAIETDQSVAEWESSNEGISIFERTYNLTQPELTGHIQPTVFSSQEKVTLPNGGEYAEKQAIDSRVQRLVDRVKAWNNLQQKPNNEKTIGLIYYSYPPGKENIGASYLNVLPQSIYTILNRLNREGYNLGTETPDTTRLYDEIMDYGRNVGNWAPAEIARIVKGGNPVLVPVHVYNEWFHQLSERFQKEVIKKWGKPEDSKIMVWKDKNGIKYFVLPAVRYGKVLLMPQPARGWGQDINKMYHDVSMPPHHQYIAFYLYLKNSLHADALIHLGTHGTQEWLSGKEAGLNDDDAPEALMNDMVNIYPYIVDDVGEGLQAKRRGMAIVIDHLTPPFDKAGMNPELKELAGLMSEYDAASQKSPQLADSKFKRIKVLAEKQGLLKDLDLSQPFSKDDIHLLEDYIEEIAEKQTPFGLHTFGQSPDAEQAQRTAEAIVSRQKDLSEAERREQENILKENLRISGENELNALIRSLNGKYIEAGQGNDPLRNPESLPTGRNFYAFDPSKIPAAEVYEKGSLLAEELVRDYRAKHNGAYPDKITFNLWSVETIRHEGVMEAQILKLLGIKPRYDTFGRVSGVDLIPREILNRPRIDVMLVPSGLYRDLFSNLMTFLDEAVQLAKEQNETDNFIRKHIMAAKKILMQEGVKDEDLAERLASVRMFSVPPGAYGTGLNDVIQASGSWEKDDQVSGVYFNRMSYLYGQGFWGVKPEDQEKSLPANFSIDLMKKGLSGTKVVVHSRSSNLYGALDNDDFFQYLGGTAMAIRAVDGTSPDVVVTNLSDPDKVGQESLDKFIGREMKARYLNPKWINEMLKEGYAGARMVNQVVANMWGWQVTVPDAIDESKWQQVYETYVEDKYQLDIKKKFREAKNMYAYQTALSRMMEVVRKGYWKPDDAVVEKLVQEYVATISEVGLSCNGNVCNNTGLEKFVNRELRQIKGLPPEMTEMYHKELAKLKQVDQTEQEVPNPEQQIAQTKADPNFKYQPKAEVKGYKIEKVSSSEKLASEVNDLTIQWGLLVLAAGFILAFFFNKE